MYFKRNKPRTTITIEREIMTERGVEEVETEHKSRMLEGRIMGAN